MIKNVKIILLMITAIMLFTGCKEEEIQFRKEGKEKKITQETTETEIKVANFSDKTTKKNVYVAPEEEKEGELLDNNMKIMYKKEKTTYGEILKKVNEEINGWTKNYKCNDELTINYTELKENSTETHKIVAIRIERQKEDIYRQEIRTSENEFYNKKIIELRKGEGEDEVLKGEFKTSDPTKEVTYELEPTDNEEDHILLRSEKAFDFGRLYGLYSFENMNNFKGIGKIKLKDFKEIIGVGLDFGLQIIKDEKITIKVKNKKGEIEEKEVNPSNLEFEYKLERRNGIYHIDIDLLDVMNKYCKYYNEYMVSKATYKLELEKNNITKEEETEEETSESEENEKK